MTQGQLNAGHLGGRFLERTFPQKVKPVPSSAIEDGVMASQIRQAPPEGNRRVRTSAAVIGLAISMGAYSLPLPNQSDEALAAEPVIGEPTANTLSSGFDVAAVSPKPETIDRVQSSPALGMVEHTVQEGQTLWQLAQFYRVDAATVAAANGISENAVLHVGQVLEIPSTGQSASAVRVDTLADNAVIDSAVSNKPSYYGPIDGVTTAVTTDRDAGFKAEQQASLTALKQTQTSLRSSLDKLKSGKQSSEQTPAVKTPALDIPVAVNSPVPITVAVNSASPAVATLSHRVVRGDTLGMIAKTYNVSLKHLMAANRLVDPNILFVNQVLVVPQATVAESASTPSVASANLPVIVASANPDHLTFPKATNVTPQLFSRSASIPVKTTQLQQTVEGQSQSNATIAVLPTQPPVVQPSPAVALDRSATSPVAIGGDIEVATAPFIGNQSTRTEQSTSNLQYGSIENLRLEIVKLREKYKGSTTQIQPIATSATKVAAASLNVTAPASAESSSTAVNPEFKSSGYVQALQAQIRQLQATRQQSQMKRSLDSAPVVVSAKQQPQLVATASIGSQNYEPLVQSAVGQMVSPNLPPLGSVDAYLPGNTGKFNGYIWPAKGMLTSGYGYRWGRLHKGIDIAAPVGTPVVAAADGVIISAGWNSGGYGNMVEIRHPDGSVTLYAHNSRIVVREGQQVTQGQQIADMGSTGYSTGPHSHFEVHLPGQGAVNPMAYLSRGQA